MTGSFAIGWRQVGACTVLLAASGMIAATYSLVAVPLQQEFHPSRMVLMLSMTIMAGLSALLSPAIGTLMDRSSLRQMMVLGCASLAAGFAALSFAASFAQVLVVYGLLFSPVTVLIGPMASSVLLSRWFARRRGTAIGIAISGVAVGGFVFPPLIQGLLDHFPWREAFRLLGLIILVVTVPAALLVVDRPADRGLYPDGADAEPDAWVAGAGIARITAREVLADPTFWCACIVFAVVLAGMKGMITNLAPLALDQGIQPTRAALLISVYSGCAFIAKLFFAAVADRVSPRLLMAASLIGFATGAAALLRADAGYAAIALGVGLIGLFGGMMVPMQGLLVARIFGPRVMGRVSGLVSLVTLCFLLASPPLFGLIFDLTGSYDGIFLAFAALAIAALALVPLIRLHPRAAPAPELVAARTA